MATRNVKVLAAFMAIALVTFLVYWLRGGPEIAHDQPKAPIEAPLPSAPEAQVTAPTPAKAAPGSPPPKPDASAETIYTAIPTGDTNAVRKVLVRAKYGPGEQELGKEVPPGEGEVFPPQGFTPTEDGKLLVLDSAKDRLVWYGKDGRFERSMPFEGLMEPADVAVAKDGTIVVIDHEGVQTKGTIMLDPSGRKKAELPQLQGAHSTGMYMVGNDILLTKEGVTTIKAGESNGSASDDTPNLYSNPDDGVIPGVVAPDGRTVVSAGIDDVEQGKFFLTSISGPKPVHNFSRYYTVPGPLYGIPFTQSDAKGGIYVVLYAHDEFHLVCFEGQRGDPVGTVRLPSPVGQTYGTPNRKFSVVPTGGIIYQELSDTGSTYEWFDCH